MLDPAAPLRQSIVALAACGLMLAACQRHEGETPIDAVPLQATPPLATTSAPPVLTRTELLAAIDGAASAYAAGEEAESDDLSGRRFSVRQAFGCNGPAPAALQDPPKDGLARWRRMANPEIFQLALVPEDWSASPLVSDGNEDWESVEGFWLTRPWLRSDDCPAARDVARDVAQANEGAGPSPQTAGLAAVFDSDGSRLGRRNGRAYAFTVRSDSGQVSSPAPVGGYHLALEGRLAVFANGRAIRCHAATTDQRPVCIAAVRLDRVAFESASGAVLSEWRPN